MDLGVYNRGLSKLLNFCRTSSVRFASVYGAVIICMGTKQTSEQCSDPIRGSGMGSWRD